MLRVVGLVALSVALAAMSAAQTQNGASAEALRAQLRDVEAKEAELHEGMRQIDEALKPENIERSLALTGSTKPEELRDQRRRQLEGEKERLRVQLDQLAASRARLSAAIATADAAAYRLSAQPVSNAPTTPANTVNAQTPRPAQKQRRRSTRRRSLSRRPRRRA
jgi:hypothetical protein